ncbi:MAG: NUDIX domain-containing protein [Patescibacteria group bacterium]
MANKEANVILVFRKMPGGREFLFGKGSPTKKVAANKIVPPGGKRKNDEELVIAAQRELRQETSIRADPSEFRHYGYFIGSADGVGYKVDIFMVEVLPTAQVRGCKEVSQWFWYHEKSIPWHEMMPDDKHWLEPILRGEKNLEIKLPSALPE